MEQSTHQRLENIDFPRLISITIMELTAHHKKSFLDFWSAGFWRLIPTFILCAFIVNCFENLFPNARPDRFQTWNDLAWNIACVPTLDIPCGILYLFTKKYGTYTTVDGAYWSLLVELKYYVLFSFLFYFLKLPRLRSILISLLGFLAFVTEFYFKSSFFNSRVNNFFMYLPFLLLEWPIMKRKKRILNGVCYP